MSDIDVNATRVPSAEIDAFVKVMYLAVPLVEWMTVDEPSVVSCSRISRCTEAPLPGISAAWE